MESKTQSILIFLFIIGFLIYLVVNQAPTSKVENLKFQNIFSYLIGANKTIDSNKATSVISSRESSIIPEKIPFGFTPDKLSPHFEKVKLEVKKTTNSQNQFSIALKTNLKKGEKINISGWWFRTNRQSSKSIPWGIKYYNPFGYSKKEPIVLETGDYVYFYFSPSPTGQSFRLNKCTGYLNNDFLFSPPLPQNCPLPSKKEISFLSGRCQSFILSLKKCEAVSPAKIQIFNRPDELSCRIYLEEFNYKNCYDDHYSDPDFLSHEWRVWLDWPLQFDPEHDRLLLFDEKGLLVDEYAY